MTYIKGLTTYTLMRIMISYGVFILCFLSLCLTSPSLNSNVVFGDFDNIITGRSVLNNFQSVKVVGTIWLFLAAWVGYKFPKWRVRGFIILSLIATCFCHLLLSKASFDSNTGAIKPALSGFELRADNSLRDFPFISYDSDLYVAPELKSYNYTSNIMSFKMKLDNKEIRSDAKETSVAFMPVSHKPFMIRTTIPTSEDDIDNAFGRILSHYAAQYGEPHSLLLQGYLWKDKNGLELYLIKDRYRITVTLTDNTLATRYKKEYQKAEGNKRRLSEERSDNKIAKTINILEQP